MRDYRVDVNSITNKLIPSYINGRKFNLFIKALVYPLQHISDLFAEWAREHLIMANMTSQTIMLEWYLDYKFSKYFKDKAKHFTVGSYSLERLRIASLYHDEYVAEHPGLSPSVYRENEGRLKNPSLYLDSTRKNSFYVLTPEPNASTIDTGEYTNMVKAVVNQYKLASKSFKIIVI